MDGLALKGVSVPLLTSNNYSVWAPLARNLLKRKRLFYYIHDGPAVRNQKKDKAEINLDMDQAFGFLESLISREIRHQVIKNEDTDPAALWQTLKDRFGSTKLDKDYLASQFYELTFPSNGSMVRHINTINDLSAQLAEIQEAPGDLAKKHVLMRALPPQYNIYRVFIGSDSSISFDDACRRLIKAEIDISREEMQNLAEAGNPQKRRKVAKSDRCRRCGGKGHHEASCVTPQQRYDNVGSKKAPVRPTVPPSYTCNICKKKGHHYTVCPNARLFGTFERDYGLNHRGGPDHQDYSDFVDVKVKEDYEE